METHPMRNHRCQCLPVDYTRICRDKHRHLLIMLVISCLFSTSISTNCFPSFQIRQGGPAVAAPHPMQYQQQPFYGQEPVSVLYASLEQYQGTIVPTHNFNPEADCQAFHQAMKGAGSSKREKTTCDLSVLMQVRMNVLWSTLSLNDLTFNGNISKCNTNPCLVKYVCWESQQRTIDTFTHFLTGFSPTNRRWTKWTFQRNHDCSLRCTSWLWCMVITSSS